MISIQISNGSTLTPYRISLRLLGYACIGIFMEEEDHWPRAIAGFSDTVFNSLEPLTFT